MNENHDDQGRFSSGAGSSMTPKPSLLGRIKDFAHGNSSRPQDHANAVPSQSRLSTIKTALTKDRFTNLVPPGSKTDRVVKEAAAWSKMGLEKSAALAIGGPVAAGGVMLAQYTKWGGSAAREFGPKLLGSIRGRK